MNTKTMSQLDLSRLHDLSEKQRISLFLRLRNMDGGSGGANRRYDERRRQETGEDFVARAHWVVTLLAQLTNQAAEYDDEIQVSTYGLQALFETLDDLLDRRFEGEPDQETATQEVAP